jgi:hypothetical protein
VDHDDAYSRDRLADGITIYSYQRVYFYVQVNRSKNNVLNLDSGESGSDEEEDNVNKGTKSWWESEQERRVVAGLRAPPDRK